MSRPINVLKETKKKSIQNTEHKAKHNKPYSEIDKYEQSCITKLNS
jgi:hypothetical protein